MLNNTYTKNIIQNTLYRVRSADRQKTKVAIDRPSQHIDEHNPIKIIFQKIKPISNAQQNKNNPQHNETNITPPNLHQLSIAVGKQHKLQN